MGARLRHSGRIMDMQERTLAIIGGSGLYELDGLQDVREERVETPFGSPSDAIVSGRIGSTRLLFLPRHGRGHRFPPHRIPFRANLCALKMLGAEMVVSVSAVGSLRHAIAPGDLVLVDQFIDRTHGREQTFFDGHVAAHVAFAEPIDAALQHALYDAAGRVGARAHLGGTYVCIQGPQFSTKAESAMYRAWGADVVGMTNLPEARLAREAELPYATMAVATDYDCWLERAEAVTVEAVLEALRSGLGSARAVLQEVLESLPDPARSPARNALRGAIMTDPSTVPEEERARLAPIVGAHLTVPPRTG